MSQCIFETRGLGMPRWGFGWYKRDLPVSSDELASSMAPFMNYCIEHFGPPTVHV
ncbi:MAG: hypothetical protein CM1200mP35_01060 [Chloroflexota bacterium]|nr:MAG: hypothetical protein CM1200mP35_01060 [Chloroflexota bacterium]